jgi:hypothetical protein
VETFLTAVRTGDLATLLRVLASDVVRRADPAALPSRGVQDHHVETLPHPGRAPDAARRGQRGEAVTEVAWSMGGPGRSCHGAFVLRFRIVDGRILEYEVIGDPRRFDRYVDLDLAAG